jgi:hypothetical protein
MSSEEIGTKLAIAEGLPATRDAAGFGALTFEQINGIVSIGARGFSNAAINVPDLETGISTTLKGEETGNTVTVTCRTIPGDDGQADAKAACEARGGTSGEYSWRETKPDGRVNYYTGPAMSLEDNEASVSSYEGFTFQVALNGRKVEVAAPT